MEAPGAASDSTPVDRHHPDASLVTVPVGKVTLPEGLNVSDISSSADGTLLLWDRAARRVLLVSPPDAPSADFVLPEAVQPVALAPVLRSGDALEILVLEEASITALDAGGGILHTDPIPPAGLPLRDAVLVGDTWYAVSREAEEAGSPGRILALRPDEGPWTTLDARPPFSGLLQAGRAGPILVERNSPHRLALYEGGNSPTLTQPWEGFVDGVQRSPGSGGWEATAAFPFEDGVAQFIHERGSFWMLMILYDGQQRGYKHPVFHGPERFVAAGPGWMISLSTGTPPAVTRYTWRWAMGQFKMTSSPPHSP